MYFILTALFLSLSLLGGIELHAVQEVITALGVLDVLNTKVDTLFDLAVTHGLVDQNLDSTGLNTEDNTSSAMVVLVRHTLLDSTVSLDVDNVPDTVGAQVCAQSDGTMLTEATLEEIPRASTITKAVRHLQGRVSKVPNIKNHLVIAYANVLNSFEKCVRNCSPSKCPEATQHRLNDYVLYAIICNVLTDTHPLLSHQVPDYIP